MKKFALVLAGLLVLPACAFSQPTWDDKTINETSLNNVCKRGIEMNLLIRGWNPDREGGWLKTVLQARVSNGNMTPHDYEGTRKWFKQNCPDGW